MDLRSMQFFLAISETGSMNKAAALLFVSQPAVSQSMAKLEKELQTELFHRRRNNSLELTPAGVRFERFCREVTDLWNQANSDLQVLRAQTGSRLIVGSSSIYLQDWIPLLGDLKEEGTPAPDFIFDTADALIARLLNHEIHLILGAYDEKNPALEYLETQVRELFLCVRSQHPLSRFSYLIPGQKGLRVPISVAKDYNFALMAPTSVIRHQTDRYFHEQNFQPVSASTVRRSDEVLIKVLSGDSVGFVSRTVAAEGQVLPLALDPPILYRTGAIYRKNYKLPPVLRRMIDRYRESFSPVDYFPECPYHPQDTAKSPSAT